MNSVLNKIAKAEAFAGGNWAAFGKYRFKVKVIKVKEGGNRGDSAIAELEVVTSENTQEGVNATKPGCVVSYVENLTDVQKGGPGRFKSFLMGLVGGTPDEFANPSKLIKFVDPAKQAGVGLLIDAEVFPKKTKSGNVVSGFNWRTVELTDENLAAIEAERKALQLPPLSKALED